MTRPRTHSSLPRSHQRQMAARRAALFFLAAGVLAIINSLFLPGAQPPHITLIALGVLDIVIAVGVYLLPWSRWPARALIAIIMLAFLVIGLFYVVGATPLLVYPVFFMLLFIWVGLTLPPRTALVLTPFTAGAYVLPLLWPGPHAALIDSAVVAVPVCTLIGEVIASALHRLHSVQEALEHQVAERTAELQATNTALEHELTERKQTEAALRLSNERFQLVARATNDTIWDDDFVQQHIWWNDNFQTMFGYHANAVEHGFGWWRTQLHPNDQARVCASFDTALARGDQFWSQEYRFRRSDGSYADVFERAYLLYDANTQPVRGIGSLMDITERKKLDRLKHAFIATVSHELRTPLTSIRGALRLLAGGVAGALPAQARAMVEIADKNSEQLLRLINDLLDIEQIETNQLSFDRTPQELTPLVEQAINVNRAYGAQFGVTFTFEQRLPGNMVNVDRGRLLQVLTNLLSNAAKFSAPGDVVSISITRSSPMLRIAISDHGPGIPIAFQARVFQKFAQADSSDTRQQGGTGLGLSISKAIMEKLGGHIGFESVSNTGTTFFVDLPEWQPAGEAVPAQSPPSERPTPLINQ